MVGAAGVALGFVMSAESIQQQESAHQDGKGNPEVDVCGDHAKQVSRAGSARTLRHSYRLNRLSDARDGSADLAWWIAS